MIKNLIIFAICVFIVYLTVKHFEKVEARLNDPYGWKTDLLLISSIIITIVFAGIAFYNLGSFFLNLFILWLD